MNFKFKFVTFQTWLDLKFSGSSSFKLENLKLIMVKLDLNLKFQVRVQVFKFSGPLLDTLVSSCYKNVFIFSVTMLSLHQCLQTLHYIFASFWFKTPVISQDKSFIVFNEEFSVRNLLLPPLSSQAV